VLIYVSLGSRAGDVLVPAVIGSQSSDAKQTLVDAGLVPQVFFYENQSDTEGKIVAQLPDPQTPVPAGSDVAIIEIARSAPEGEEIAPE
jgi:beta-lactam-binding protein with PASTA domain